MKKLATMFTTVLLLCACTTTKTNFVPTVITTPTFKPADPRAVTMLEFKWQVLETKRLQALLDQAKKDGNSDLVVFALSPKDYQNLSLDMAELARYIQQQKALLTYYKTQASTH